jgi:hypothetical protein
MDGWEDGEEGKELGEVFSEDELGAGALGKRGPCG